MYSFPNFEPVCCFMSGSNYWSLTCIQVLPEASKVGWYSHFFKNFTWFVVIYTANDFSIVSDAEVDVFFWKSFTFSMIQWMWAIRSSGSSVFSKSSLYIWKFFIHVLFRFFRRPVRWYGSPIFLRIFHGLLWFTVKGFNVVNEAEVDVVLELPCFLYDPTAAAKSLRSCPTLCDPIDGSPPGSPIPGILQATPITLMGIILKQEPGGL